MAVVSITTQPGLFSSVVFNLVHLRRVWRVGYNVQYAAWRRVGRHTATKDVPAGQLAGKICTVIDLTTRLPVEVWFSERARACDTTFISDLLAVVPKKNLLILNRGVYDFKFFAALVQQGTAFITRLKSNAKIEVVTTLTQTDTIKDLIFTFSTSFQRSALERYLESSK